MTHGRGSPNAGAPPLLRSLLDGIDWLSRLDGWLGAVCLGSLTALMIAEVAVRALSDVFAWIPADIPVAWEYSSYLMAATFTFGAAMTLRAGGHIRVTLVLARVSAATRRRMETVLAALGACFCGYFAWAMADFTWRSFESGQTSVSSGTLLWMPKALVTFGIILLTVQFIARFFQAVLGLPLETLDMRARAVAE